MSIMCVNPTFGPGDHITRNVESLPPLPLWRFVQILAEVNAQKWGPLDLQEWVDRLLARRDDVLYHRAGGMGSLESWVRTRGSDLRGKAFQLDVQFAIWKLNAEAGNDKSPIDPDWVKRSLRFFRNGDGDQKWIDQTSFKTALAHAASLSTRPERRTGRGTRTHANDGCRCNSREEVRIDNWLSEAGIPHKKEIKYPHHPIYNKSGQKRVDWLVGSTWVEYVGLWSEQEYRKRFKDKIDLAQALKLDLVVILKEHLPRVEAYLEERLGHHRRPN